ncbi:MAG: hypothetical protein RR827_04545 [Oscillospiraceae bacterium]
MKKATTLAYLVATLFFVANAISSRLNLNPLYPGTAFFYCIMISVYVGIWALSKAGKLVMTRREDGMMSVDFERKASFPKAPVILVAVVWAAYAIVTVGSSVIFNVSAFRDQMPDYKVGNFGEDIQVIDTTQIPIVDKDLAAKIAEKKLGEKPSLGSQVVLGTPTVQTVDGKLVWVVPLQHSGFFKWITNMQGTPGYIVVSATNPQDVDYVDTYNIKYQPNAYLFDDLTFHTRYTAALFTGTTDYSFELDDSGKPHWVITTYKYTRGFALPEATGVIVMDAQSGKSTKYALADVPAWVDRVQPEEFIIRQVSNKGEYVHGIFNFSDKDKYKPSQGSIIVYNNGRCYLFTGVTSVGADESAIGFVMVDMVTKEPIMYQMSGATEYAAQRSAMGKVQQYGYYASFPLIINFDGTPTYFMTLKDDDGLIKQYSYVSVKDFLVVGVGESVTDAKLNYEKALRQNPGSITAENSDKIKKITGKVARIAQESVAGQSMYRMILENKTSMLFNVQSTVSEELAITQAGDEVSISYHEGAAAISEVTEFDNLTFKQGE